MSDCVVRIERLANGFEVEITDPKIMEANRKADSKSPWRDPHVGYAFKTVQEVIDFLSKNLEKAMPADEYDSAFSEAAEEDDD